MKISLNRVFWILFQLKGALILIPKSLLSDFRHKTAQQERSFPLYLFCMRNFYPSYLLWFNNQCPSNVQASQPIRRMVYQQVLDIPGSRTFHSFRLLQVLQIVADGLKPVTQQRPEHQPTSTTQSTKCTSYCTSGLVPEMGNSDHCRDTVPATNQFKIRSLKIPPPNSFNFQVLLLLSPSSSFT